jgi:hypothetical protein
MSDQHVRLTEAAGPVQAAVIEAALEEAGIPYTTQEIDPLAVLVSAVAPMSLREFRVPADRLEEAKEVLCSNDIVCEVSERLLHRTFEEVVKPLLGAEQPDLERLLYLIGINNKDTVRALFERTREAPGGTELLEVLFFAMAREDSPRLLVLARHLASRTTEVFGQRYIRGVEEGPDAARIALLNVLPEFRQEPWRLKALASCLLAETDEVRDAAAEALFAIKGSDCGYDPEADPAEREHALERILRGEREGGVET